MTDFTYFGIPCHALEERELTAALKHAQEADRLKIWVEFMPRGVTCAEMVEAEMMRRLRRIVDRVAA